MTCPKKNAKVLLVSNELRQQLKKRFNFIPDNYNIERISYQIIKQLAYHESASALTSRKGLVNIYRRWFKRQNFLDTRPEKHSAMGFVSWIIDHYWIIQIRKPIWMTRQRNLKKNN